MKKSRFIHFSKKVNQSKLTFLDALHRAYLDYLKICVNLLIDQKKLNLHITKHAEFFPTQKVLPAIFVQQVTSHAVDIVKGWSSSLYQTKVKKQITILNKNEWLSDEDAKQLYTIGKCWLNESEKIPEEAFSLYWDLLLASGDFPIISDRVGMYLDNRNCRFQKSKTKQFSYWLWISTLVKKSPIEIPLSTNPYIFSSDQVVNGSLLRKNSKGRWILQKLEKQEYPDPSKEYSHFLGVDVGLNALAATSDGRTLGAAFKKKFDKKKSKIDQIRANRQRQGLKENSKRLQRLEENLSGFIKTATGTVANKLVKDYPNTAFVVEDLDLRGSPGSKRFAYRALQRSMEQKALVIKVNPAYSSQTCPSCGYLSKKNRNGTKFRCQCCGKISHADIVGSVNILRRSQDAVINSSKATLPSVKTLLEERFRLRRSLNRPSSIVEKNGVAILQPDANQSIHKVNGAAFKN